MADREKLIELLCEAKSKSADDAWFSDATYAEQLAMEADHLIANGVTVLPCNVGDKIYYIDRFTHKVEKDTVKFLTITKNGVKPILTRHNIKFWDFYELGKTVFFTKEEAEAHLPQLPKGE
jgi:hypothetical protein